MFVPREPRAAGQPDDRHTAEQQPVQEPGGIGRPGTPQPGAEQPARERPAADVPDVDQPDSEPGTEEPKADQSSGEPDAGEPDGEPEVGEPNREERPRVAPVPLPDGLADVPAGPWLCEALESVDPELISGFDTVEVMGAAYRQANRQRAIFLRTLLETGLRARDSGDRVVRASAPGEFAAEEARAALVWSRRRAETALGLAMDVFTRLPALGEAMLGGWLDEPRAKAFTEWTRGLTDEQAGTICVDLLPVAPNLMVGELITRIQRAAYAIDPDWAQRRYEDTLATRRIIASRNEDGTANVEGRNLPVDRAAAACDRIDTLARAVKHAGAGKRRIDHIRVDLFLGSTDGTFEGMSDEQIIAHVVNHPLVTDPNPDDTTTGTTGTGNEEADDDSSDVADEGGVGDTGFTDDEPDDGTPGGGDAEGGPGGPGGAPGGGDGESDDGDPATGSDATEDGIGDRGGPAAGGGSWARDDDFAGRPGGWPDPDSGDESAGAATSTGATVPPAACGWAVGELRVELATLLGWNDHPGEIPGTGYLPATLARRLAAAMASGQWRYVICGPLGRLITCGIQSGRPRPPGGIPRRDTRRGGIVEIGVTTGQLHQLATTANGHGRWAGVITELVDHYNTHLADTNPRFNNTRPDDGTRAPATGQGTSAPNASDGMSVPDSGQDADLGDARRRLPGAKLRRDIQMRDRQCVHIACRMPATRTDLDHAHDYVEGGLTTAANLSSVCRWHHRLKHDGHWTVSKPEPAMTLWGTPLGHTYVSVPPLVMPRLPNPQPRNTDGYDLLPDKTTRGCGCYGHCSCGPTMPTDEMNTRTETQAPDQPTPDSDDTPLNIDDEPPY